MNRLKEFRTNKGLSQFDLGRVVGVHPQKISNYERGQCDLRLKEAIKIARTLQVNVDDLVEEAQRE